MLDLIARRTRQTHKRTPHTHTRRPPHRAAKSKIAGKVLVYSLPLESLLLELLLKVCNSAGNVKTFRRENTFERDCTQQRLLYLL